MSGATPNTAYAVTLHISTAADPTCSAAFVVAPVATDGPAPALHCAKAIRRSAARQGLRIRAGVHVGEVELVGGNLRGGTVHEAARIMGKAGADEILVSETTRVLASTSGLEFDDRGTHKLEGLAGDWRLHALAGS